MRRLMTYAVIVLAIVIGGIAYLNANSMTSSGITEYYAPASSPVVLGGEPYRDENVLIQIVGVEEDVAEYVVRVEALNEDTTVIYSYPELDNHSTLRPGADIMDEVQEGHLDMVRIHVYAQSGAILKRPMNGFVFADNPDVTSYDSVAEARAALQTE